MTASVIEKMEIQSEANKSKAFQSLVAELDTGKTVAPDVVSKVLADTGKNWQQLKEALAELSATRESRVLAAQAPKLQAEAKRLAGIVGTEREKLVELLKAHKLAEDVQSKTIRDAEASHQAAHSEASRAAAAESQLIKLSAKECPELSREYQEARIKAHTARQRKPVTEARLRDLPGAIASLKSRIGSSAGHADDLETKLEQLESELIQVRKDFDSLVKDTPKFEQAEADARKALLTALIS